MSIRIGILGYGNLGKGVESAIAQNPDMELAAVFTRRNPEQVTVRTKRVQVLSADEQDHMQGDIDVLILCGGSATDLPEQTHKYAAMYNVVDSFDFLWMGSGDVLFKSSVCILRAAGGSGLYLLGKRREPGPF